MVGNAGPQGRRNTKIGYFLFEVVIVYVTIGE